MAVTLTSPDPTQLVPLYLLLSRLHLGHLQAFHLVSIFFPISLFTPTPQGLFPTFTT